MKGEYGESLILEVTLNKELEFEWELGLNALHEILKPTFIYFDTDTKCTLFGYLVRINNVDKDAVNLWVKV